MENKINYQRLLEEIIRENAGEKPRLLLHSCCAPCSSAVLAYLSEYFRITLLYYNPNISSAAEFDHRAAELRRLVKEMGLSDIDVLVPPYCHQEFLDIAKGLEEEPERGRRCVKCFHQRLERTAREMKEWNEGHPEAAFSYFCTTLTISPLKDAQLLNRLGMQIAAQYALRFLPSDFKKKGGYQRSIELSRQYALYRQNFCGCEFSQREAEERRKLDIGTSEK